MAEEDQFQKPCGDEGREVIRKMNEHHRELTIWGLSNIPTPSAKTILDIGCGGGVALKLLSLKYPNAKCNGIDISQDCVDATLEYNKIYKQWGKVDAQVASVEDIPFPEESMDIVTAIETYFFWPDLEKNIRHIVTRMRAGGVLCIISEQYFTDANKAKLEGDCVTYHMTLVENDRMKEIMENAGLTFTMVLDPDKNWVTYLGTKN